MINGIRDTVPLIVGAIPFGILFGALANAAGLSILATLGLSLFVFAGSAQFICATLVSQGASLGIIVLTTFVVNLRHALYSASLGPYLRHLTWRWQMPLGFWLTDETYAIVIKRYQDTDGSNCKHWYFFGSALAMYVNWQICTVIGIVTGQALTGMKDWGLEFAMVVTFIGIVVPLVTSLPMLICAVVAGVVGVLARDLPNHSGLIVASLAAIAAGLLSSLAFQGSPSNTADFDPSRSRRGK